LHTQAPVPAATAACMVSTNLAAACICM
jgi:hypothetical protein